MANFPKVDSKNILFLNKSIILAPKVFLLLCILASIFPFSFSKYIQSFAKTSAIKNGLCVAKINLNLFSEYFSSNSVINSYKNILLHSGCKKASTSSNKRVIYFLFLNSPFKILYNVEK